MVSSVSVAHWKRWAAVDMKSLMAVKDYCERLGSRLREAAIWHVSLGDKGVYAACIAAVGNLEIAMRIISIACELVTRQAYVVSPDAGVVFLGSRRLTPRLVSNRDR